MKSSGESHQDKDDRRVYISFPQADDEQVQPSAVICIGMVKALIRVTVAGADCTLHPARRQKHGLAVSRYNSAQVRSQPLRLALVDHWRAIPCGEGAGDGQESRAGDTEAQAGTSQALTEQHASVMFSTFRM